MGNAETLLAAINLSTNSTGVDASAVSDAIKEVYSINRTTMKADYSKLGDVGDVAFKNANKTKRLFKSAPLTIVSLYKKIVELGKLKGKGSKQKKQSAVQKMLVVRANA